MEKPKAKVPRVKPLTRLQQQAPPILQLDNINDDNVDDTYHSYSSNDNTSCCPIPLLSPLILSPLPLPGPEGNRFTKGAENDEQGGGDRGSGGDGGGGEKKAISPPQFGGGWRHPAVEPSPDPSTLFSFFQNQCVLVNRVQ
ncbi:hypothetical protein NMG60_11034102 [Bertholletia excelsa]